MSETPLEPETDTDQSPGPPSWLIPGILAALLVLMTSIAGWLWWDTRPPSSDSADAGFARDMTDHHSQAVEMAMIVYQRTESDDIRLLAYDIATSQQAQIGMMQGWLTEWDFSLARSEPPMAWAGDEMEGHDMSGVETISQMPGMADREEIDQLRTLEPAEMDIEFLRLMIAHHEGGVMMAEAGVELVEEDVLHDLAATIVTSQSAEITTMQNMLAEREET